jgi:hypothetical protein
MTQLGFEQGESLAAMAQREPETPLISDLDHRINYGRAAIGLVGERLSSAVESVADSVSASASALVETMPKPGRKTGVVGIAAAAIGSTAPALAARTSESATSSQGSQANIRYYKQGDRKFTKLIAAKIKGCRDDSIAMSPYFNSRKNPSGFDSNKYMNGRFVFPDKGKKSELQLQFRKGFCICFAYGEIMQGNKQFVIPEEDLIIKGNKVRYPDIVPRFDPSGKTMAAAYVWAEPK